MGLSLTTAGPAPAATAALDLQGASIDQLILAANSHYEQAQEYLRVGDWGGYGAEMDALQQVLEQLVAITGIELTAPAPATTEAPPRPSERERLFTTSLAWLHSSLTEPD